MLSTLLAVALASSPNAPPAAGAGSVASSTDPVKLASPGLTLVGITADEGTFFLDYFISKLTRSDEIVVVTPREMSALIGLERQRQLLDCSGTEGGCGSDVTEIASALNVDGIISGSLGVAEDAYVATLNLVRARDARTVSHVVIEVEGQRALLRAFADAAPRMAQELLTALGRTQSASGLAGEPTGASAAGGSTTDPASTTLARREAPRPRGLADPKVLAAGGAGLGLTIAGGVLYGLAAAEHARLREDTFPDVQSVEAAQRQGAQFQTLSVALTAAGVVGLGLASWFLLQQPPDPSHALATPQELAVVNARVGLVPIPSGAVFVLTGVLP